MGRVSEGPWVEFWGFPKTGSPWAWGLWKGDECLAREQWGGRYEGEEAPPPNTDARVLPRLLPSCSGAAWERLGLARAAPEQLVGSTRASVLGGGDPPLILMKMLISLGAVLKNTPAKEGVPPP